MQGEPGFAWFGLLLSAIAIACTVHVQARTDCSKFSHYDSPYFDTGYSYLYLKLEEALINDQKALDKLRAVFISIDRDIVLQFYNFQLEVVNGTSNDSCGSHSDKTFCNSGSADYMWKLCYYDGLDMTYSSESFEVLQLQNDRNTVNRYVQWLYLLYGTVMPAFIFVKRNYYYSRVNGEIELTLRIDELKCNPSLELTKCILSELFSWIRVYSYSEGGRKPLTWDQDLKGSVVNGIYFYDYDYYDYDSHNQVIEFMTWTIDVHTFVRLALAEYVFVSLSLALVIAKFFPAIHSQIVTKAASSLEYQSLYWGSAVVANVFTYGLVFLASKGWFTLWQCLFYPTNQMLYIKCTESLWILSIMQLVVYVTLFAGALIASLRSPRGIPMPTGMGKVMINISFCFSCFCFCVCCSPRCRAKTLQVLVMFSFMCFIYHSIMDAISIGFIMFNEEYRTLFITLAPLYISLIIFIIIYISFSLFLAIRDRNETFHKQVLNCFGGSLMLVTVFGAVMLMVVMYMIIFFSLRLTGISGIATGLVPSIALSAASWYIKKRIEYGYMRGGVTDGGRETTDAITTDGSLLLHAP